MEQSDFKVLEHNFGQILRLETPEAYAMDLAIELLGLFESELDAEVEDTGWKRGYGLAVAAPVAIRLESLDVELVTDGSEVLIRRIGGSKDEFEGLCDFVQAHSDRA